MELLNNICMWTFYSSIVTACLVGIIAYVHKTLSERSAPVKEFVTETQPDKDDQIKLSA